MVVNTALGALMLLIGFLLGTGLCLFQLSQEKKKPKKWDGIFLINTSSVEKEILSLNLSTDLDTLQEKGYMEVKVEVQ